MRRDIVLLLAILGLVILFYYWLTNKAESQTSEDGNDGNSDADRSHFEETEDVKESEWFFHTFNGEGEFQRHGKVEGKDGVDQANFLGGLFTLDNVQIEGSAEGQVYAAGKVSGHVEGTYTKKWKEL